MTSACLVEETISTSNRNSNISIQALQRGKTTHQTVPQALADVTPLGLGRLRVRNPMPNGNDTNTLSEQFHSTVNRMRGYAKGREQVTVS